MQNNKQLLSYLQRAVNELLEQGHFDGGQPFRPAQRKAFQGYKVFLDNEKLPPKERLTAHVVKAAGLGKTAIQAGITGKLHKFAQEDGIDFRSVVVQPSLHLMRQNSLAAVDYAPNLESLIGLFGGSSRDMSHPVTYITNPSFVNLIDTGQMTPENTAAVFNDESHTFTSEKRVDAITSTFHGAAIVFGLTATDKFNIAKTVALTHGTCVSRTGMKEGVETGQSAAYINSRLDTLRVHPPTKEQIKKFSEVNKGRGNIFQEYCRAKWSEWAISHFRETPDYITDDPLHDNQAGFFVDGIRHANNLEKMLNNDPVLKKIAKERGCKGVAVAIHSEIPTEGEQIERLEDYKEGKYLALVADEMFKEGHDFPRMKTAFNWQRGSLVEEEQYIGRVNRKLWNSKKARWEGATIFEAATYIGSNDPNEDKRREEEALAWMIKASEVAGGTTVLGPGIVLRSERSGKRKPTPEIIIPGTTITARVTPKENQTITTKVEKLRNKHGDLIEVTDLMFSDLLAHQERTGLGGHALYNRINSPPEGLSAHIASNIISGWQKTVHPEHLKCILETFALQPDSRIRLVSRQDQRKMQTESKRTGLGGHALYNRIVNPPDDLTIHMCEGTVSGSVKSAIPEHVATIIETYACQPDNKRELISSKDAAHLKAEAKRTGLGGSGIFKYIDEPPEGLTAKESQTIIRGGTKNAVPAYVTALKETYAKQLDSEFTIKSKPILSEDVTHLKAEAKRTGLGGRAIFSLISDTPEGLTSGIAHYIIIGKRKTVPPECITVLKKTYAEQPGAKIKVELQPVSPEDLEYFRAEEERTGLNGYSLFNLISNSPEELTRDRCKHIVSGRLKFSSAQEIAALKEAYTKLPDTKLEPISSEDAAYLKAEAERTGLGGVAIFNLIPDPQEGWGRHKASSIISRTAQFAPPGFIKAIKKTYSEQPNSAGEKKPISPEDKVYLKAEVKRTGLGSASIFSLMSEVPEGLTVSKIELIISGTQKSAIPIYVAALKEAYARQPDVEYRVRPRQISPIDAAYLKAEAERTGLGGMAILSRMPSPPKGLTNPVALRIVSGKVETADRKHIIALKEAYALQCDRNQGPVSAEDIEYIRAEAQRTGLKGQAIFNRIANPPEGLTKQIAFGFISGKQKFAPPEYFLKLKEAYAEQPDAEFKTESELISIADAAHLKAEAERTGLGGIAVLRTMLNPPKGLTKDFANDMVSGERKKAPLEYITALKQAYAQLPDSEVKGKPELISFEDLEYLKAEAERTGLGGSAIFRRVNNPPKGLKWTTARGIVSGKTKATLPEYVTALKQAYSSLPNKAPEPSHPEF